MSTGYKTVNGEKTLLESSNLIRNNKNVRFHHENPLLLNTDVNVYTEG